MLWFRIIGAIGLHPATSTGPSDARINAMLKHQQRALDVLDRELQLYQEHHRQDAMQHEQR